MAWSKSKKANVGVKIAASAGMVIVGSMFIAVSQGKTDGLYHMANWAGSAGGDIDIEKEKLNLLFNYQLEDDAIFNAPITGDSLTRVKLNFSKIKNATDLKVSKDSDGTIHIKGTVSKNINKIKASTNGSAYKEINKPEDIEFDIKVADPSILKLSDCQTNNPNAYLIDSEGNIVSLEDAAKKSGTQQYYYYDNEDQNYTPVDVVDGKVPYVHASKIINPKINPSTTDISATQGQDESLKIPTDSQYSTQGGKVLFNGKEVNNAGVVLPTTKTDSFSKYLAFSAPKGQYLTSLQDINSDAYIAVQDGTSPNPKFIKISDYTKLSPKPKLMESKYDATAKTFSWQEKGTQTIEATDVYANNNTNLKYFDTNLNPKLKLPTGGGTLPSYVVPTGTKTLETTNPDAYIAVKDDNLSTPKLIKISDYTKLSSKPQLMESKYDTKTKTFSWQEKSTQTIEATDVYAKGNTAFSQPGISIDNSGNVSQVKPVLPTNITKNDILSVRYIPSANGLTTLSTGGGTLPSYVVPTGTKTLETANPDAYIAVKDDNLSTPKLIKISDYTKLSPKPKLMESKYNATDKTYSWKEKGTQTIEVKDVYATSNTAFSQPGITISDGNIKLDHGLVAARDFYLDNTAIAVAWENGDYMKGWGTVSNPRLISLREYYTQCISKNKFMPVVKFNEQGTGVNVDINNESALLDYIKNPGFKYLTTANSIFNANSTSTFLTTSTQGNSNLKAIDVDKIANGKIKAPERLPINTSAADIEVTNLSKDTLKNITTSYPDVENNFEKILHNNNVLLGVGLWLLIAGVLSLCFSINRMAKDEQDTSDLEGFLGVPHGDDDGLVGFGKVITSVLDTALGGIPAALATGIGGGVIR